MILLEAYKLDKKDEIKGLDKYVNVYKKNIFEPSACLNNA